MRRVAVVVGGAVLATACAAGTEQPVPPSGQIARATTVDAVGADHLERDAAGSYVCVLRRSGDLAALRASAAP